MPSRVRSNFSSNWNPSAKTDDPYRYQFHDRLFARCTRQAIDHALLDQIAVFSPVTLTELLSAPNLSTTLRQTFLAIPILPLQDGFWERAGLLRAKILGKGSKARLADTLIAQTCLDHHIPLVTRDQDFQTFNRFAKLKLL